MFVKVSRSNVIYTIDLERDEYNLIQTTNKSLPDHHVGIQFGVSSPGICGSTIVHENGTVLGMHVAGNSDGVGSAIV